MLETPTDFNETMTRGERVYKYVMAPQLRCHVCDDFLEHSYPLKKEWCVNEQCQVFDIRFNIMSRTVQAEA